MAEEINDIVDHSFNEEEDFEEVDDFESEEFEEDTIYCQYCQMGFTDFDEWKAHEEEEASAKGGAGENNTENEPLEVDDAGKEEIFCQYCQKGFSDFDEWKLHEEEEARSVNKIATDNLDVPQTNIGEMGDSLADIRNDFEQKVEESDVNRGGSNNSDNLYEPQPHFSEIKESFVDNLIDAKHELNINEAAISDDFSQVQMNSGITSAVDLTHIDDTKSIMKDDSVVTEKNFAEIQPETSIDICDGKMGNEEAETNGVINVEVDSFVCEENKDADMVHEVEDNSDSDLTPNDLDNWDITDTEDMSKNKSEEVQTNFDENKDRAEAGSIDSSLESSQTLDNIHGNFNGQNLTMEHAKFEIESEIHVDVNGGNQEINKSDDYSLENHPVAAQSKDEDKIFCQYCELAFTDFDEWKAHEEEEAKSAMESFNPDESKLENDLENIKTSEEEKIYCQYCRQAFTDFDEWKLHEEEERKSLDQSQPTQNINTFYCQHCEKPFSDFNEWKLHEEEEGKIIELKHHEEEEGKMVDSTSFASNMEIPLTNNSNAPSEIDSPVVNNSNPAPETEMPLMNNINAAPDMEKPVMNSPTLAPDTENPSAMEKIRMNGSSSENDLQKPDGDSEKQKIIPNIAPGMENPMMNATGFQPGMPRPMMNNPGFRPGMPGPMMNNPGFHPGMPGPLNNLGFYPGMPRPMMNNPGFHPGMPRPMMNNPGFHPGMPRPIMNNPGMPRPMMNNSIAEMINKRPMSQEEAENKPDMKRLKTNPFQCKQCPNTYENKEAMQRHMKYHSTGGPPHILTKQQIDILNNCYYNKSKIPTDDILLELSQVLNIESHAYIQSWFRSKLNISPTKNERKPPISIPSSIQISRVSSETSRIDGKSADDQMKNNYVSRAFSKDQLEIMWSYFNRLEANNEKLAYSIRDEIARKTSLPPNSIASWFTYQRRRKGTLGRLNNPQMASTGSIDSQTSPTSKSKSPTMSSNPELNEKIRKHNAIGDRLTSLVQQVEKFRKELDAAKSSLEERINLNDSGFEEKDYSPNTSLEDGNPKQNFPNAAQNQQTGFPNPPNAPNGMFNNPNLPFHPMMYGFPPNAPPQFAQSGPPQFAKNGPPQFPPNGPQFAPQGLPQFPPNMPPQFLPHAPPQYLQNMPGPLGNMPSHGNMPPQGNMPLPIGNMPPQGNMPPHGNMPPQFNQSSSIGFNQVPFNDVISKQEPQIKQEQQ